MRTVRALIAILLSLTLLSAQEDPKAIAAFAKAFQSTAKTAAVKAPPIEERKAALAGLASQDAPKVAESLVAGWNALEDEIGAVEQARVAAVQELEAMLSPPDAKGTRHYPADKRDRHNELKGLLGEFRDRSAALLGVQAAVAERIRSLRRRDTLLWLLQKQVAGRKGGMGLRVAIGKALGGGAAEVMPELAAALERSREPEEQLTLLLAMGAAGKTARLHATPVIALLQSKEEAVREQAAAALARIAVPEAVGPMVQAMLASTGQAQARIAAALEVLTGQPFGLNFAAWQQWWQTEGKAFASGEKPLGEGKPSKGRSDNGNYYFGIPQDQSNGILYLLDCSGSMKAEITLKLPAGGKGTVAAGNAEANKTTRLEACKAELIRALGRLQPRQKFAILWYADQPHWWVPKMQDASKDVVEQAQAFVRTLEPSSSTNIHDSLELGFTLVGRGARDRYYGMMLDTIFLLTDGSPTRPDGKPDAVEPILEGVRAWNPLHRVTIHTIGIGDGLNEQFLRQLAQDNGGEFQRF